MDTILLKEKAEALLVVLRKYSSVNPEVMALFSSLRPLLEASLEYKIQSPIEWRDVPGAYQFTDGSLRQHRDLEEAYAQFKIEVTGGESPALKKFDQTRKNQN